MMQRSKHHNDYRSMGTIHLHPTKPLPPPQRQEGEEVVHENIFVKPMEKIRRKKFQKQ